MSRIVEERTQTITDPGIRRAYRRLAEERGTVTDAGQAAEAFLALVLKLEQSGQDQLVEACRQSFR